MLFGKLLLGVGAMKAGTTWLYSVLERHPHVKFSPEKEIHYFYHRYVNDNLLCDRKRLELAKTRYIERIDPSKANIDRVRLNLHWVAAYLSKPVDDFWYRNLFPNAGPDDWKADFSNLNALLPEDAWRYIANNCDELRVLYTLRDPISRLWSHTKFHLQVTGGLSYLETWGPDEYEKFVRQRFIWENAEYGEAIRRMNSALPRGALRVQFLEEMQERPIGAINEIEDFLGIVRARYPEEILKRRVNESISRDMPDFFPSLFAKEIRRIRRELEDLGVRVPESWNSRRP